MAYFAPYIDATGLHIPAYADIYTFVLGQFEAVYGTIVDTDNSNADIQYVSNQALIINDAFQATQLAYNSRSPVTAIGSDLDAIGQINGVARKVASASTVNLTVVGTPGTIIPAGFAIDQQGNRWSLPVNLTIPIAGTTTVQASCQTFGPIAAPANTISTIGNPQAGWTSVNNAAAATLGTPIETDSLYRARIVLSAAYVAKTLVESTISGIMAVSGVTRVAPPVPTPGGAQGSSVENPTASTDSWGNPAHSISMVVEGGTNTDVATAIYNNKTPGCLTNGTTTVPVTDPVSGVAINIAFSRPTYVPIYVIMNVHGLPTLTTAMQTNIQNAVVNYLQGLQIGEAVTMSGLIAAAMATMPNILQPLFSIRTTYLGTAPSPTLSNDIVLTYNQVAQGLVANITVNSV